MIAKIMKGSSFKVTVNYILDNKKEATLIDCEGIRTLDNQSMIRDFSLQAQLNPKVSKCVGHIALNFSEEDKNKISNEFMIKVAREYMQRMGITNTQYMIGRHFDKSHPHIHICYNRVDNEGKTISDKNDRIRSGKICKELTLKYGLHYASNDRKRVKTHRLKEPYRTKHDIFRTIGECLSMSSNWGEFLAYMKSADIDVQFKTKGKSNEIQGIIFSKNGYSFSGSKVSKMYSFSNLNKELSSKYNYETAKNQGVSTESISGNSLKVDLSIFDTIPTHLYDASGEEPSNKNKRKLGR